MITLVRCNKCLEMKPPSDFYRRKSNPGRQFCQSSCKNCHSIESTNWYAKNRDRRASVTLKLKYGKTLSDKQAQRDQQEGICTLCEKPLPVSLSKCEWDHDHKTGQLRDLLHGRCNKFVGVVESDLHEKAIAYVDQHRVKGLRKS